MPKKTTPISDIKAPDKVKPSTTARPLVASGKPMVMRDPMVVPAQGGGATDVPSEPKTAPEVSRTAKTLQPVHDIAGTEAGPAAPPPAEPAVAGTPEKPAEPEPPVGTDEDQEAAGSSTTPTTEPDPGSKPEPEATVPGETADPAHGPVPLEPETDGGTSAKTSAKDDAEAAKAEAAARERAEEMQKLIDSHQYYVSVADIERKRSVHTSLWLTLLVIALSIVLIDFMLDANVIVLLTKLPHTHFFAPQPHF